MCGKHKCNLIFLRVDEFRLTFKLMTLCCCWLCNHCILATAATTTSKYKSFKVHFKDLQMHVVQQKGHCIRVVFFRSGVTETLTNFIDFSDRSELFSFDFNEISFSYFYWFLSEVYVWFKTFPSFFETEFFEDVSIIFVRNSIKQSRRKFYMSS